MLDMATPTYIPTPEGAQLTAQYMDGKYTREQWRDYWRARKRRRRLMILSDGLLDRVERITLRHEQNRVGMNSRRIPRELARMIRELAEAAGMDTVAFPSSNDSWDVYQAQKRVYEIQREITGVQDLDDEEDEQTEG